MWHYHNAVRYREERNEELMTLMEFHMACTNPELYREHMKSKGGTSYEVASYNENMTEEDFLRMTEMAERQFKPSQSKHATQEPAANNAPAESGAEPVSEPVSAPTRPKWGRPSHLPPIVILDAPAVTNDDNGPNDQRSSTMWE